MDVVLYGILKHAVHVLINQVRLHIAAWLEIVRLQSAIAYA